MEFDIAIENNHLEIVLEILKNNFDGATIYAFGSRVKKNHRPYSDLDLAVIMPHKISLQTLSKVRSEFSDSNLPYKVDLIDWHSLSEDFKKIIKTNCIVLLDSPKGN